MLEEQDDWRDRGHSIICRIPMHHDGSNYR